MNLLPKWVLTDNNPSIFDTESMTVIEQTARVYKAMQTLIEEYNVFAERVNESVAEFTKSSTEEYNIFRVALRQEFQDFIDTIDLKVLSQDKKLNEALKDTLLSMIEEMRDSGEFTEDILAVFNDIISAITVEKNQRVQNDNTINEAIELLETRLNNLSTLEEGSTTGDAELIDARTDFNGVVHTNLGEHIRTVTSQLSNENENIKNSIMFENKYYPLHEIMDSLQEGYTIGTSGDFRVTENRVSSKKYVENINEFSFYMPANFHISYCTYDENNTMIVNSGYSGNGKYVTIPVGKLRFTFRKADNTSITIEEIRNIIPTFSQDMNVNINNLIRECTQNELLFNLFHSLTQSYGINVGGQFYPASNRVASPLYFINTSEFHIRLRKGYNIVYALYDENDAQLINSGWLSGIVTIPVGRLRFGFRKSTDTTISLDEAKNSIVKIWESANEGITSHLAPLILGDKGSTKGYVFFDTINRTITFPADTLIISPIFSNGYKQITTSGNDIIVDYSGITSTAVKVVYNIQTNTITAMKYSDDVNYQNEILMCVFRSNYPDARYIYAVSIACPYAVDGKPFNLSSTSTPLIRNNNVKGTNHRGYYTAPENTLSAYRLSKENGFDYVECDVSFTSDNVPVLLHDETIDRTSNGTGSINEMTFEEVRTYDFGSWKSTDYEGEQIPSFEEFILLCRNLGLHPYIELKNNGSYTGEQIQQCVNIVKRYGMKDKVSWISFNPNYLVHVKNYYSKARLGYIVGEITSDIITTTTSYLKTNENDVFINAYYVTLTDDMCELCNNADLPLEVWTVNTLADLVSLNPYVSGIASDSLNAGVSLVEHNL